MDEQAEELEKLRREVRILAGGAEARIAELEAKAAR